MEPGGYSLKYARTQTSREKVCQQVTQLQQKIITSILIRYLSYIAKQINRIAVFYLCKTFWQKVEVKLP